MKYKVFLRNKETFKTFYELEIHFYSLFPSLRVNQLIEKGISREKKSRCYQAGKAKVCHGFLNSNQNFSKSSEQAQRMTGLE